MANQREHLGYRMSAWRYCPSCSIELKLTIAWYSPRDRWRRHFTDDHKLDSAEAERRIIDYGPGVARIAERMPIAPPKKDHLP